MENIVVVSIVCISYQYYSNKEHTVVISTSHSKGPSNFG